MFNCILVIFLRQTPRNRNTGLNASYFFKLLLPNLVNFTEGCDEEEWLTNICIIKKYFSSINVFRKVDKHMQKNEIGPLPYTTPKMNSTLIKNLNIKSETILTCRRKYRKRLLDIGLCKSFSGYDNKSTRNKGKNKLLGLYEY